MKKIAVFTGTRAEYGLLYWLIKEIDLDSGLELQLIVSGTHLSPEFGHTLDAIEGDGFGVSEKVEMLLSSSSKVGIAKSIGLGVIGFADALGRLQPDCLVLLGDRFEAFAVAQAAMVLQIPIAHIHGGESTEGLIDEAIRHSITKMAHLHFTSTELYRKRVIQLGESPENVFNFGAPAVENIRRLELLSQAELETSLRFELGNQPLLVTYHPVTLAKDGGIEALKNLLTVLDREATDHKIVVTFPNADTFACKAISILQDYASKNNDRVLLTKSLGQLRYLSLMAISGAVIGNSSSGLLEAPAFGVPTVDIGIRQKGRFKPISIVGCGETISEIGVALNEALSDSHKEACKVAPNPFGDGFVSEKIVSVLNSTDLKNLAFKSFFDLEFA